MNKTVLVMEVAKKYTEGFLPQANNNSAAMLSKWDRKIDPVLNFLWFQL